MREKNIGVRTRKEIKQGLLKKAIREGRGAEMMLLIQWRLEQVRHQTSHDEAILQEVRELDEGQPRSIRMLNTFARMSGAPERYINNGDTNISPGSPSIH